MSIKRSRLLLRLDEALSADKRSTQSPMELHRLRAQRAMALVRQGDMSAARADLTLLHEVAFSHPNPELSAWLHLAEALVAYYTDFGPTADDRLQRALLLGRAANSTVVQAHAHGYLALQAFNQFRYEDVGRHVHEGLVIADANDGVVRSRLCLIGGIALHHAEAVEAAQVWYAKARQHASREGDDALLSALIHNSAQMRVAAVRRAELRGRSAVVAGLLPGVDSISNFDQAMGVNSLDILTPLLRAQVLVVTGDYAPALALYERFLPKALAQGLERMGSSLLADTAWCRVQLGQHEAALKQAQESELELELTRHPDDRAATFARLAQLYRQLDMGERAAPLQAQADTAFAQFDECQSRLRQALMGVVPT